MRHSLKILVLVVIAILLTGYGLFMYISPRDNAFFSAIALCALGVITILYVARRLLVFRKRITQILKMLISGNYEVDIRHRRIFKDEIDTTSDFIEKFLGQLREYENLRVERISLLSRTLDLLLDLVKEEIIIIDMCKNTFRCNAAARKFFNVQEGTYTLKSMTSQDENRELTRMFLNATEKKKIPQEGKVTIQLPVNSAKREVYLKIVPLKDKKERVCKALGFISADGKL
ncbi:MAG: hypothetical protein ABH875_07430 [Candidatus Omnitrophota bacterium]